MATLLHPLEKGQHLVKHIFRYVLEGEIVAFNLCILGHHRGALGAEKKVYQYWWHIFAYELFDAKVFGIWGLPCSRLNILEDLRDVSF